MAHPAHRIARPAQNTAHRVLRIAHPAQNTAPPVQHILRPVQHIPPRAHPTARPVLHSALHPVLRPAPLQVQADPLQVPLRVQVVPVPFHQGVKATFPYEIEFGATDLLGWVNILLCYRA